MLTLVGYDTGHNVHGSARANAHLEIHLGYSSEGLTSLLLSLHTVVAWSRYSHPLVDVVLATRLVATLGLLGVSKSFRDALWNKKTYRSAPGRDRMTVTLGLASSTTVRMIN